MNGAIAPAAMDDAIAGMIRIMNWCLGMRENRRRMDGVMVGLVGGGCTGSCLMSRAESSDVRGETLSSYGMTSTFIVGKEKESGGAQNTHPSFSYHTTIGFSKQ